MTKADKVRPIQSGCQRVLHKHEPVYANPQEGVSKPRGLLKETIAAQLREEILAGRIAAGEKIIEGLGTPIGCSAGFHSRSAQYPRC
jgi:hypothetical protein